MVMLPTATGTVAGGAQDVAATPVSYGTNPTSSTGTASADPAAALAQQWSYLTGLVATPPTQQVPNINLNPSTSPTQNSFTPMRIQ